MGRTVEDDAKRIELQLQAVRRAMRQEFDAEIAKGVEKIKLTLPQQLVMAEVVKQNGVSLKDLSARISLAHSTVSGIVDRLVKQGLAERRTLAEDKRVSVIVASAVVKNFLQTNMPRMNRQPLVKALLKATPAERKAVAEGLDALERLLGKLSA